MADHYCTLDDVNEYSPQAPFTATSKPSDNTVIDMIEMIATEMDAEMFTAGYVVPVVGDALALAWMRETCRYGVLGIAFDVRNSGVATAINASRKEYKNIWTQKFEARMAALLDPQTKPSALTGAQTTPPTPSPTSTPSSSVQAVSDILWLTPLVTRDQVL